jgi:hypothetical protein
MRVTQAFFTRYISPSQSRGEFFSMLSVASVHRDPGTQADSRPHAFSTAFAIAGDAA